MMESATNLAQHLERESLTKRAADAIRDKILTGKYKLGQRLRESELAQHFGVSHNVIREAFHVLQGEGIVVTDSYRGRSVLSITKEEAKELVVVRTSLECLAAQLAAEKLDDEWKQKILAEAARVKTAGPVDKVARVQIELAFHRTIWAAAQNAWLYDQLNKLATLLFTLNAMSFFEIDMTPEEIPVSFLQWETKNHIRGHQGVARAVLSGNPRNARESMILHVMGAPPLADRRKQVFQI